MKVRVDKETCVGDETCVDECPEVFEIQGDVAVAKMENVPKELEKKVEDILIEGIKRARANGRRTLQARDL